MPRPPAPAQWGRVFFWGGEANFSISSLCLYSLLLFPTLFFPFSLFSFPKLAPAMPHSVPNSPPPESPPEIFSSVHDLVLPEPENLDPDPDPSRQQDRSSPNVLFPPFRYALPAWQKVLIEPRRFAHKPRIRVFKANLLVKMAKRLFPRSENLDFDSLRKAAAQAGHARLEEAGIPPSYGKYVRRLEEVSNSPPLPPPPKKQKNLTSIITNAILLLVFLLVNVIITVLSKPNQRAHRRRIRGSADLAPVLRIPHVLQMEGRLPHCVRDDDGGIGNEVQVQRRRRAQRGEPRAK